jgi:Tol biopolymer transport system component/DNA-binding winged helix-turn-helix (wHTH) protein
MGSVFEFDDVRVDPAAFRVLKAHQPVTMEPKAFDLLVFLLENRDRLIEKQELLDVIWKDTTVAENALTRLVAQLRKALGDPATGPRYIETVPTRGYRFIAQVKVLTNGAHVPDRAATPPARRWVWIAVPAALAALAAAGITAGLFLEWPAAPKQAPSPAFTRFTTRSGYEGMGAVSPDGKSLAYVSDRTGSLEIYVTSFAFGSQDLAITSDGGNNMEPDWSPDGQWLAFHSHKRRGIWIVPATGGTPRQVVDFGSKPAWSPDGSQIAFTSHSGGGFFQSTIWVVSRDGTTRRQLTRVGDPPGGHDMPSWSPDGRMVAFVVSGAGGYYGWHGTAAVVSVADGHVTQFWHLVGSGAIGPTLLGIGFPRFSPDGRWIFWLELAGADLRIARMPVGPDDVPAGNTEPVRSLESGIPDGFSIGRDGTAAVGIIHGEWNLWRVDAPTDGVSEARDEPVRLTEEGVRMGRPDYSIEGQIAYTQMNLGRPASSWVMNEDGSGRRPLLDPPTSFPEWTRDGKWIIAVHGEDSRFWRIDPATGRGTPLAINVNIMGFPRASPDGDAVAYHVVQPDGILNVWVRPLDGGPARQLTFDKQAMGFPAWSPDGKWLAVQIMRGDNTYMGVLPSGGGTVEQLVFEPGLTFVHSWSPDGKEIAFAGERGGVWNIYAVSRETRRIRQFTHLTSAAGFVRYPSWSPRGGRIAFERQIRRSIVWTGKLSE